VAGDEGIECHDFARMLLRIDYPRRVALYVALEILSFTSRLTDRKSKTDRRFFLGLEK
jgi:hypothetical protein